MSLQRIDAMTEAAVEALSSSDMPRDLSRHLAAGWPDAPALEAAFALAAAGAALEDLFSPEGTVQNPAEIAFRAAALLASDIFTLKSLGLEAPTLRDVDKLSRRLPR